MLTRTVHHRCRVEEAYGEDDINDREEKHMRVDSAWYHISEIRTVVGDQELAEDIATDCEGQPSKYKKVRDRGLKQYWWSKAMWKTSSSLS